jgi:formiminotetrahydrofolate cyclodeaminase
MFSEKGLGEFLDELASSSPAPGGGSVAAIAGALGAALVSMVCNLTIGKEKYKDVELDMKALLEQSEALRAKLTGLVDADVQAYNKLSAAYKLPKATDEERKARSAAIQKALVEATEVPFEVARQCTAVMDLCVPGAEKGSTAAISDIGVGALLAEAGLRAAAMNVMINLGAIKDQRFVRQSRRQLKALMKGRSRQKEAVIKVVEGKL